MGGWWWRVTVRGNESAVEFVRVTPRRGALVLSVPGRIVRRFEGVLKVTRESALTATITMPLETAVASVVAAESSPGAALEALKAQAVAARSYYSGGSRHSGGSDFCDTTHCQFLRQPPDVGSLPAQAAAATRHLVLTFDGKILQALYSASCGGRTKSLREAGMREQPYSYYAVQCTRCREKKSSGHGIGMCQEGASGLAARGVSFEQILNRYYPGARVQSVGFGPSHRTTPQKP